MRDFLRDVAIPGEVNILPGQRVGDPARRKYQDHLDSLYADGYMTRDEHEARTEIAQKAVTSDHLNALIRDLPALPAPKQRRLKLGWDDPKTYVPALVLGMMLSVAVAVSPFVIMDSLGDFHSPAMAPVGIGSVLIGVIGFVSSLVAMVAKLEK
jgi:hypothetical protein